MDVFVKAILRKARRSSSLAAAQYSGHLFTIRKHDHSHPPPSPGDVYSLWAVRMPFTKILSGHFSESPLDLDPGTFHPLIPTCLPAVYLHCPCVCGTDLRVSPHHRILFAVVLLQVVLGLGKWAFSFFKASYMNVQLYFANLCIPTLNSSHLFCYDESHWKTNKRVYYNVKYLPKDRQGAEKSIHYHREQWKQGCVSLWKGHWVQRGNWTL